MEFVLGMAAGIAYGQYQQRLVSCARHLALATIKLLVTSNEPHMIFSKKQWCQYRQCEAS